jgi:hypothetical protein
VSLRWLVRRPLALAAVTLVAAVAAAAGWAAAGDELRGIRPVTLEGWVRSATPVVALVVLWFVLRRLIRNAGARVVVMVVLVSGFLVYAVRPAFVDERVDEAIPGVATPAAVPAAGPEAAAGLEAAAGPETATGAPVTRVSSGTLRGIGHRASGTASLLRLADGSHLVRLDDLDSQNGPDLYVYLVPQPGQRGDAGAVNLGRLKANQGNQNYVVPAGVDVSGFHTVLIWCRMFATPFANATLS